VFAVSQVSNCGKEKGKVTLKMRKQEARMWVDSWRSSRETIDDEDNGPAAVTGTSNEPIITTPSDDDEN